MKLWGFLLHVHCFSLLWVLIVGMDSDGISAGPVEIPATVEVMAPIDGVKILVRETDPSQYVVHIISGLPTGCARFGRITWERVRDTIRIQVFNRVPASKDVMCTMIYGTHVSEVNLGTDFELGRSYRVRVNNVKESFAVSEGEQAQSR